MTEPLLCVTVTGPSMEDLRRSRDAASDADLVELRLDLVDRPDVAGALHGRRTPVIVTCRAAWEGGKFSGSEDERRRILESAAALGAEYVDVEAAASFAPDFIRARAGKGVIASSHLFGTPPADLPDRYASLRRDWCRSGEACHPGVDARRDAAAVRPGGEQPGRTGPRARPHRHGQSGCRHARARGAAPQPLDVCRRRRRSRSDAGRHDCCESSGSGESRPTPRSTRSSATRSFTRDRRSCTTPGSPHSD